MAVRLIYLLSVLAIVTAGWVLARSASGWQSSAETSLRVQAGEKVLENHMGVNGPVGPSRESVSPLVAAAEEFASYLNPLDVEELSPTPVFASSPLPAIPPIRPAVASAKFNLRATSFYPNQPGRSMALIAEFGLLEGNERWVKEGTQVGHFVIHEIRQGAIVYRDGDQLREMTVDVAAAPRSLVRDIRPGSRTASAAVEGPGVVAPTSAGPNIVTLTGN